MVCVERGVEKLQEDNVFIDVDPEEKNFDLAWKQDAAIDDALGALIKKLKPVPVLKDKELRTLVKKYKDTRSPEVLEMLALFDYRFLLSCAYKFKRNAGSLSVVDLTQAAWPAYVKAVLLYDPSKGTKFHTYAQLWISQQMRREIASAGEVIDVPDYFNSSVTAVKRAFNGMHVSNEKITPELIAARTDLSIKKCIEIHAHLLRWGNIDSLDRMWTTKGLLNDDFYSCNVGSLITSDYDLEEIVEEEADRRKLRLWVKQLPKTKRMYISQRFGMLDGEEKSRAFLAHQLKMSEKQATKFEEEILEDLRIIGQRDELNASYGDRPVLDDKKVKRRKTFRKHSRTSEID